MKQPAYQYSYNTKTIVDWLMSNNILLFNKEEPFKLKSGGTSTYFFNAGNINKGGALGIMGLMYQQKMREILKGIDKDVVIFGSAYKGISICVVVSQILDTMNKYRNAYFCFNRKEIKTHGEKIRYVGKDMKGMYVFIVDDVLTSGKSILEAHEFVTKRGGDVIGAAVLIDRMEKADVEKNGVTIITAKEVVSKQLGIDIVSIIDVESIADCLISEGQHVEECEDMLKAIGRTREK